jgi:hypothetical protein
LTKLFFLTSPQSVFDLFGVLPDMKVLPFSPSVDIGTLVPYQMTNEDSSGQPQEYWCYNNISKYGSYKGITSQDTSHDPFQMNTDGNIPDK